MKKLQEMITKDLGWKLLSVIIAVILWFMVINIEHPIDTRAYTQSIVFENTEALTAQGLTLQNPEELENLKITIKVKAQRTELDRLSQYKNYIKATVDLGSITNVQGGDTLNLPVQIKLPDIAGSGFEIISKSPSLLNISVEQLITVQKLVEPEFTGTTAEGYVLTDTTINPQAVHVKGAESLINQISAVKASIDSQQLQQSVIVTSSPIAYDINGNEIKGIEISPNEVSVSLGIYRSKTLNLSAATEGTLHQGYSLEKVTCSPTSIEVFGAKEVLSQLKEITLPAIDVTDATKTITKTFSLRSLLPEGVSLKSDASGLVQVTAEIHSESKKQLKVPVDNLTITGKNADLFDYYFDQDTFSVEVTGSASQISTLSADTLSGKIDVSSLLAGKHVLQITMGLPDGVRLSGNTPETTVTVSERKNTETTPETPASQTQTDENES